MNLDINLEDVILEEQLIDYISEIFKVSKKEIASLYSNDNSKKIYFCTNQRNSGFCFNIQVFLADELSQSRDIKSDFDFAKKMLEKINKDILITDISILYTWWLITATGEIFEADEIILKSDSENDLGILIDRTKLKLISEAEVMKAISP